MPAALIARLETSDRLADAVKHHLRHMFRNSRAASANADPWREGDKATHVALLLSGFGYRCRQLANGRRQIVGYVVPGDLLTAGPLAAPVHDHSLRLTEASTYATLPDPELATLEPFLLRLLTRLVARELSISREWIANLGQREARARVAHLFCELSVRMRDIGQADGSSFPFPVTQQEIADSVGFTIVHVNRTLQALRRDGALAFDGRRAIVADFVRLTAIAGFDARYLD